MLHGFPTKFHGFSPKNHGESPALTFASWLLAATRKREEARSAERAAFVPEGWMETPENHGEKCENHRKTIGQW